MATRSRRIALASAQASGRFALRGEGPPGFAQGACERHPPVRVAGKGVARAGAPRGRSFSRSVFVAMHMMQESNIGN